MNSEELINAMAEIRYEPTRLLGHLMDQIEKSVDGETLVMDPSLPFPHLVELNVVLATAGIQHNELLDRKQYPVLATTEDELFRHMSDDDHVGMFATPGEAYFYMMFAKEELIAKSVKVSDTGTKRITIPRHTRITVNNVPFTFQYPINFIIKAHGGIDVVYDGSKPSPLQPLLGNRVEWESVKLAGNVAGAQVPVEFIRIKVRLKQMHIESHLLSVSSASILKKSYLLRDQFYYGRAFYKDRQGKYVEMKTTHSQQVFDPMDPTLLLKVVDNTLTAELPYVYHATDLVSREIRLDIYTTKGEAIMDMAGMGSPAFSAEWIDLDKDDGGVYVAPLSLISTALIFSDDMLSGGSDAPTFEERRERVLRNSNGNAVIPILPGHIDNELEQLGFESAKIVDNLETRTYLATRSMPSNPSGRTLTGIDSAVITMKMSLSKLAETANVSDNGLRVTLLPDNIFRNNNGVLEIVPRSEIEAIERLRGEAYVNALTEKSYLYTPLHYVLDTNGHMFEARPYFMTNPTIDIASFKASNDTLGLTVSSDSAMTITYDAGGYTLKVLSRSNDAWKALPDDQVHLQLAFKPTGEATYAYINGRLAGVTKTNERVYEFRIDTNWDIDSEHRITLTNFTMNEDAPRQLLAWLTTEFSLIWAVSDYSVPDMQYTEVDSVLGKYLLPDNSVGIYHESVKIRLGDELTGLWSSARSAAGEIEYEVYEHDIPAYWERNEYYIDAATGMPVIEIDGDGKKQLKIKHAKGSPKLDENGNPIYLARAGWPKRDENGELIPVKGREVVRWWDMVLFDGVYRFATNSMDQEYRNTVAKVIVEWVNDTLGSLRNKLIGQSKLYFQPRNTLKMVEALVDESEVRIIPAAQRLTVSIYVYGDVYRNGELRGAMESATINAVVTTLDNQTVTRRGLEDAIVNRLSGDAVSVSVKGLGGEDYDVITLLDNTSRLCAAKTLVLEPNGQAAVAYSIVVEFKLHSTDR